MSAFGYLGSKLRIASKLCADLPPHNAWVELFCGSAAMTFAKSPAPIEVINDINGEIVNFFEQLRNNGEELLRLITLTPYAREEFDIARSNGSKKFSKVERARRFFVAAMMAINGSFGDAPGGFSLSNSYTRKGMEARVSRWIGMPDYLHPIIQRLQNIRIERKDGLTLFKEFMNRPATLVYCDPPYLGKRTRGYDFDQITSAFHEKLLGQMVRAKCMVFVSGYENELYDEVLVRDHHWTKKIIQAVTKGNNGKSFERQEVVWCNPAYCKAQTTGSLQLRLTKAESYNKKVNPQRKS